MNLSSCSDPREGLIDWLRAQLHETDPAQALLDEHYIIERKVNWTDEQGDDWQNHQPVCVVCVPKYSNIRVPYDLGPCLKVRQLAAAYADRAGYREEWRP